LSVAPILKEKAMKPQQERLKALAYFVPIFMEPGFQFGSWEKPAPDESGVLSLPWFTLSKAASDFESVCYEFEWVSQFDWSGWRETATSKRLMESSEQVSTASAGELAKMLTVFIRGERFYDGTLNSAFDQGFLTAIVQRAAALLVEFT
jgi:hypothetical protein